MDLIAPPRIEDRPARSCLVIRTVTPVVPGTLPAGRYATLTGRDHSLRANRALLDWVAASGAPPGCAPTTAGVELDREGDRSGAATRPA